MAEGRASERGAALLTVLLLVAVIAVMAGEMLETLRLATRRSANAVGGEQARAWAMAAETMATTRIDSLLSRAADRVTLQGGWSGRPFALPVPGGGTATARVTDGGNCFNLNGLVYEASPGLYATYGPSRDQFQRLMRSIGIPAASAEQVAGGAADWIDSDDDQQASGAEDPRYTGGQVGYRTAGTLMVDKSELRAVAGVTPDIYATLKPWICTLPLPAPASINVNTLSPEQAPLLAMLGADAPPVDAIRARLSARPAGGWTDPTAVWTGLAVPAGAPAQTGVTTRWFALSVDVHTLGAELEERALIDARRLPVRLLARQWGEDT